MARATCVVVGAGGISGAWFPPLIEEQVRLLAVVDLNLEAARGRLAQYGLDAEAATRLRPTLEKHQPDFVVDLTVPEAHCQVTCAALEAGCHVLGEKPMAATMAQARKMVCASEATGKLYMVSQSRRWEARHDQIQRALVAGKLGVLTTANCDFYIGAHFGGFRDEMPSPLILDMSIHHFDLVRYFTGKNPEWVYCKEFNPQGSWYRGDVAASAVFGMSDGLIFSYRGSWCAEGCHTSWHGDWRFIGDQGTMIYEKDTDAWGEVLAGSGGFHRPRKPLKLPAPRLKYGAMHGALREMLAFLRTGKQPQTECHDNLHSLAMVFAAIESNRKGKPVPVRVF